MKIEVTEDGAIRLSEVFNGVYLQTTEGNQISVCARDDTFEIAVLPLHGNGVTLHRVDMQTGDINDLFSQTEGEKDEG